MSVFFFSPHKPNGGLLAWLTAKANEARLKLAQDAVAKTGQDTSANS